MTRTNNYAQHKDIHGRIGKQSQLSLKATIKIAWQSIRVRIVRSLLVTSGIILALAFLTYILLSSALQEYICTNASEDLLEHLRRAGKLIIADADAKIQTRWMVGLALLVSLVGVLNAMLLSVTERFREIGTMKCLGALDSLIVKLFLLESTFQGIVGTALGIIVGIILTLVEGMNIYGAALWNLIPLSAVIETIGICFIAGTALTIFGALYPAWVAARMEPVDAMRMEV